MKCLSALFAIAVATAVSARSDPIGEQWDSFKREHNKKYYSEAEESSRMTIFIANQRMIAEHNQRYEQGLVTFSLKMNQFGDMTQDEVNEIWNGFKMPQNVSGTTFTLPANAQAAPAEMDWRTKGAVTPVKNQASCGSSYAFSSTGAIEGQHFIKKGALVSLSEQNLVDCTVSYGNRGCDGGRMDLCFKYVKNNKGIDTEASYPYEETVGQCRYKPENKGADVVGFTLLPPGDEQSLLQAVANVGPVAVAIDAKAKTFLYYNGGVYYEKNCSPKILTHAFLAVGYGTDPQHGDYWLVKNSWSTSWGEAGYIKMARNKSNNCGIATYALYPHV